ncbi:hypothetical protein HQ576_10290 [bacterium]|nr:hypothetical protein [bacterium]
MSSLACQLVAALLAATTVPVGQWTIHSDRQEDPLAHLAQRLLPSAQAELERTLGLTLNGRATVVLCGSAERFRQATPGVDHRHTLGVAYPARRAIFVNCEAIAAQPFEPLNITLRHEITHLLIGEAERAGRQSVPLWFNEGVAVWTSGKLPRYDVRRYRRAVASGALRPLDQLAKAFPLHPEQRGIAYEQSESVVRYLVKRHGHDVVRRILRRVAEGQRFDAAMHEATGTNVAALERDWRAAEEPLFPWLSWLLNTFTLFSAMSVLALFSFWVYWRRRRRKLQEWEMEESYYGGEGVPWQ